MGLQLIKAKGHWLGSYIPKHCPCSLLLPACLYKCRISFSPVISSLLLLPQKSFVGSKVNLTDFSISAGYGEFAGKLVEALREAIETDLSDAEERQVSPDTL